VTWAGVSVCSWGGGRGGEKGVCVCVVGETGHVSGGGGGGKGGGGYDGRWQQRCGTGMARIVQYSNKHSNNTVIRDRL
jgi:hypothetical protein